MSGSDIRFAGTHLTIGVHHFRLRWAIEAAWRSGDCIVVLFDPDAVQAKFGQFPNLIAIDDRGTELWIAELPTSTTGDRYYRVRSEDPIIVSSFSSYACAIDAATGCILAREFVH